MRFLRVFPWAFYFCKARADVGNRCDCNSIDHLFKKDRKRCDNCGYARPALGLFSPCARRVGASVSTCAQIRQTGFKA